DLVAELLAEDLERRLVQRFGGCSHLTEVEEDRHKGAGLNGVAGQRLDLVCEVRDGCAAAPTDGLAIAAGDVDATDDRRRPHLELLPLRPTRPALLGLAAALTEGTSCATTRSATTASAAAWATCEAATGTCTGTASGTTGTTGTAGTAWTLLERSATGTTSLATARCTRTWRTCARSTRARRPGTRSLRTRDVARRRALSHALRRGERVVARTGAGGTLS